MTAKQVAKNAPPQNAMPDAMKFKPDLKPQAAFPSALRGLAAAVGLALAVVASAPQGASAQGVVVLVNGDPITNFDIEQRSKLLQVSTQKTPPRQEVVEELINEKLKIQLLKRYTIPDIDKDVDNAYANMARRMRQSPKEFGEQLGKTGHHARDAEVAHEGRHRLDTDHPRPLPGELPVQRRDIQSEDRRQASARHGADHRVLRLHAATRSCSWCRAARRPRRVEARAKEAEALRAQFQNCEDGIALARNVRFVAVRAPVTKNSAELPRGACATS